MKIIKALFFVILCSGVDVAASEPSGLAMINNNTKWKLKISYKDHKKHIKELSLDPEKQGESISIADIYSNNFITIKHDDYFNPLTTKAPQENNGATILGTIKKYANQLSGRRVLIVNISLSEDKFVIDTEVATRSEYNDNLRKIKQKRLAREFDFLSFEDFVDLLPQAYRDQIIAKAQSALGGEAELHKFFDEAQQNEKTTIVGSLLELIGKAYGFTTRSTSGGNIYFSSPLMTGERKEGILQAGGALLKQYENHLIRKQEQEAKKLIPIMFDNYKIHLMPEEKDRLEAVIKLVEAIIKNPLLQSTIMQFKVSGVDNPYVQKTSGNPHTGQNAVIVIYTADGKKNTQDALNEIYKLFKGFKGMNVRPRYNAKVNDLIWIGQGDGDYKAEPWSKYYDKDGIYYKPEAFGQPANLDLKLKHPETGKDLVEIK